MLYRARTNCAVHVPRVLATPFIIVLHMHERSALGGQGSSSLPSMIIVFTTLSLLV